MTMCTAEANLHKATVKGLTTNMTTLFVDADRFSHLTS